MLAYTRARRPTPTVSARCCSVACSFLGLTRSTTFSALEAHSDNILQHGHRTASLLKIHQRFVYLPDGQLDLISASIRLALPLALSLSRSLPLLLPPSLSLSPSLAASLSLPLSLSLSLSLFVPFSFITLRFLPTHFKRLKGCVKTRKLLLLK